MTVELAHDVEGTGPLVLLIHGITENLTATVRAPYLALDGSDPGPGHLEWLQQRIPQAQLEVWAGVGHYPHLVRPGQFLRRVKAFEQELAD